MGKIQYGEDMQKLQKKLIPVNIAVIILCLVAAFTILFAPFITIDVGKVMTAISEQSQEESGSSSGGSSYLDALGDSNIKISFSAMDVQKFAFAKEPSTVVMDKVTDIIKDNQDEIFVSAAMIAVQMFVSEISGSGSEEKVAAAVKDMDMKSVIKKLNDIDGATSRSDAEVRIGAFSGQLVDELNRVLEKVGGDNPVKEHTAEIKNEIDELFLGMYDKAAEQNVPFSIEAGICLLISENMLPEGSKPVTTYAELINLLMDNDSGNNGDGSGSSSDGAMDEFNKTLNDVAAYAKYVFFVFLGIALLYILLALVALLKIFLQNKRFCMWYVKLFGFLPCLLFGVLPLVAGAVLPSIIGGEGGNMIGAIIGAISSFMWISGVCYVLLWGISIFWAFPIKRKIRKLKKEYKRGEKTAA